MILRFCLLTMDKHNLRAGSSPECEREKVLSREEAQMQETGITYKNVVLIPLAAYDDGLYAAMLIIGEMNGLQRATGVLGHFPCPVDARKFALAYGMAEVDERGPAQPQCGQPGATEPEAARI
jgi:hypothetical protein